MKCPACATVLPDDAVFCFSCGTEIAASQEETSSNLEIALAAANLLRVRGSYSEAERRCIEVLRADPNNVHAHSLLGDIYRDQGRFEDARQWYQMALDLNPRSRPDREKLAEVNRKVAENKRFKDEDAAHKRSTALVRWLAVVLAVCVLGAISAIVVNRGRRSSHGPNVTIAETPSSETGTAQPSGPPAAGTQAAAPQPAHNGNADELSTEDFDTAAGDALPEREQYLEQTLAEGRPWDADAAEHTVVLLGNGSQALVLLRTAYGAEAPAEDKIALQTLRAVHLVFVTDPAVNAVDVVLKDVDSSGASRVLLRARALRNTIATFPAPANGYEARRAFSLWRWYAQSPSQGVTAP